MGFSPGDFNSRGDKLHWEGRGNGEIILWDRYGAKCILWMTTGEARKALDQLKLLVEMAEDK